MIESLIEFNRNPDILDALAIMSTDEIFTPPIIANRVLDLLPESIWSDPTKKFLEPCSKSGVFLREIVKRLLVELEESIPDRLERREHIFRNMVYGIALSRLTGLAKHDFDQHGKYKICRKKRTNISDDHNYETVAKYTNRITDSKNFAFLVIFVANIAHLARQSVQIQSMFTR